METEEVGSGGQLQDSSDEEGAHARGECSHWCYAPQLVDGHAMLVLGAWRGALDAAKREKLLLEAEVEQIDQLEQVLLRLQRINEQLRAILVDWDEGDAQGNATGSDGPFISAQRRLNWGYVKSVPTAWPLAGPLLRSFSPAFPAVVIATVEGSPVCASASGTVVRAGYDTLLGQLIIIDHGNGIETHYGYNSALFVSEGEHILKGQHIAHSGRGGRAPYEGLYYAVREGRAFRDPIHYRLWL